MRKHTPGPWTREQAQDGECLPDGTGYAGDYYDTNTVGYQEPEGEFYAVADCYNGADAQLIAAAPDLYEAARAVLDWFETYQVERRQRYREFVADFRRRHPEVTDEPDDLPELPVAILLRAALAKAEGTP